MPSNAFSCSFKGSSFTHLGRKSCLHTTFHIPRSVTSPSPSFTTFSTTLCVFLVALLGLLSYRSFGAALFLWRWVPLSTAVNCQPLLALVIFSALHYVPAPPQVLLGGTGRLCRRLSTQSAPCGAGGFLRPPWDVLCLSPYLINSISDLDVEDISSEAYAL